MCVYIKTAYIYISNDMKYLGDLVFCSYQCVACVLNLSFRSSRISVLMGLSTGS